MVAATVRFCDFLFKGKVATCRVSTVLETSRHRVVVRPREREETTRERDTEVAAATFFINERNESVNSSSLELLVLGARSDERVVRKAAKHGHSHYTRVCARSLEATRDEEENADE